MGKRENCKYEAENFFKNIKNEQILEISINDYLKLARTKKDLLKGYRTGVDFEEKPLPFDPYILGYWLGDGTNRDSVITSQESTVLHYMSRNLGKYNLFLSKRSDTYSYGISGISGKPNSNCFLNLLKSYDLRETKYIPLIYKCNSRENRLRLLAGIIDADGSYSQGSFEISQSLNHEKLMDDIIYLSRSLGFHVINKKRKLAGHIRELKKSHMLGKY